jgi:hypothetical protein
MATTPTPEDLQRDVVLDLRAKIHQRRELSAKLKSALEDIIVQLERAILQTKRTLNSQGQLERRTELHKEVLRCQHAILAEELACWRDVTELEKEMREMQHDTVLLGGDETAPAC